VVVVDCLDQMIFSCPRNTNFMCCKYVTRQPMKLSTKFYIDRSALILVSAGSSVCRGCTFNLLLTRTANFQLAEPVLMRHGKPFLAFSLLATTFTWAESLDFGLGHNQSQTKPTDQWTCISVGLVAALPFRNGLVWSNVGVQHWSGFCIFKSARNTLQSSLVFAVEKPAKRPIPSGCLL
jgi:hypothetical protein